MFSLTPVEEAAPTEKEERLSRPNKVTKKPVATSYSRKRLVTKNADPGQNLTTASGKTVATLEGDRLLKTQTWKRAILR